jgi:hypothetical protein
LKLYQIPRNSIIYEDCDDGSSWIKFKRIDGSYSVCITEKGNIVHLGANTELESIDKNEYIIVSNNE